MKLERVVNFYEFNILYIISLLIKIIGGLL